MSEVEDGNLDPLLQEGQAIDLTSLVDIMLRPVYEDVIEWRAAIRERIADAGNDPELLMAALNAAQRDVGIVRDSMQKALLATSYVEPPAPVVLGEIADIDSLKSKIAALSHETPITFIGTIYDEIIKLRIQGYSNGNIANYLGISATHLSNIKYGRKTSVSPGLKTKMIEWLKWFSQALETVPSS